MKTYKSPSPKLDIFNFLLWKSGLETEDLAHPAFYVPKEVMPIGRIIFDTTLKKVPTPPEITDKIFSKALKLLNRAYPNKSCEWCERI